MSTHYMVMIQLDFSRNKSVESKLIFEESINKVGDVKEISKNRASKLLLLEEPIQTMIVNLSSASGKS